MFKGDVFEWNEPAPAPQSPAHVPSGDFWDRILGLPTYALIILCGVLIALMAYII